MGLYLCIMSDPELEEEIDGFEVGPYGYLEGIQQVVTSRLEGGIAGNHFPQFVLHDSTDGLWTPKGCVELRRELAEITDAFRNLPTISYPSEWNWKIENIHGSVPQNLYECLLTPEGDFLLERLQALCDVAIDSRLPIPFQ